MKTSLARIFVKNSFCVQCIPSIQQKVTEVKHIKNVTLYPSESLVVFNFNKANQVSEVLNTLMEIGYPPQMDRISTTNFKSSFCKCSA